MPRATARSAKKPTAKQREMEARLEAQLERVVEKAPRQVFHHETHEEGRLPAAEPVSSSIPSRVPDAVRALDHALMARTFSRTDAHVAKRISIRFEEHASSAHIISFQGMARRFVEDVRDVVGDTVRRWMAPYSTPPSIDRMVSEAKDLVIDEVDPHSVLMQFTPADADVAFGERYGLWSKIRAPFIKWEIAVQPTPADHFRRDEAAVRVHAATAIDAAALHDEQFTSEQAEPAPANAPGWGSKVAKAFRHAEHDVETVVEEVWEREQDIIAEAEEAWGVPALVPKLQPLRVMVGFLALLFVVSLPAGAVSLSRSFGASLAQIKSQSRNALAEVRTAVASSGSAQSDAWSQATRRFKAADAALTQANALAVALAQALPQTRELYQTTKSLIRAGEKLSESGRLLSQGFSKAIDEPALHPDERLMAFLTYLNAAIPALDDARSAMAEVNASGLPDTIRPQVETLKSTVAVGQSSLRDLQTIAQLLLRAAGHDRPRTYLLVFQNQTELRPTGGFMGSLAEVTVDRGEIQKVFVPGGGPYDLRNQLRTRVVPPKPLQLIASRWEFQDANWFPDFPTAAKKINWFWSHAGQPTLDGVITVNETLMEKLLTITGPIDMPEYGKTISADNFLLETQKAVELEYDKTENKPKKFIGDLMPKLLARLKGGSHDQWLQTISLFVEALETKEVQIALLNPDEEAQVETFGWSGQIKSTPGDHLALVEANIAGQKTDGVIDESVVHEAQIAEDGSITDTVTLTRTHKGEKGELFRGVNNVEYVRLYVPEGSELLAASGFQPPTTTLFKVPLAEDPTDPDVTTLVQNRRVGPGGVDVTEEFGSTAFGAWVQLAPGATSVTTFRYRLPFRAQDLASRFSDQPNGAADRAAYMLLLTSQSGKANRTIKTSLIPPPSWSTAYSKMPETGSSGLTWQGVWDRDRALADLFDTSHAQAQETPTP